MLDILGPLGLVKYGDLFDRSISRGKGIVAEMMNVLNEGRRIAVLTRFASCLAYLPRLGHRVESEGFTQHFHERPISREEHRMFVAVRALAGGGKVKPGKLPEPGTPVMKQMILRRSRLAVSIVWAT